MANVLLVDDMDLVRGAIKSILTRAGRAVTEASNGEDALALLQKQRFDLVMTDMVMPRRDGADVLMYLRSLHNRPPVLAMSGGSTGLSANEALSLARQHADAVVAKPFDNRELIATVNGLLEAARA